MLVLLAFKIGHGFRCKQDIVFNQSSSNINARVESFDPGADVFMEWDKIPQLIQRSYSRGSSFTIEAPWLLPTQKVGGVVELSTKTRRTFVNRGRRYSTISPLFGLSRRMRSLYSPPDHASPFLSAVTSSGHDSGFGAIHSWKRSLRVSYIPMRFALFSPNQSLPATSSMPRRGAELGVGVGYTEVFPVFASMCPISPRPNTVK